MKKIFRLANAEFNKIFLRPSIFILTALLIISLVLSNFMYKPVTLTSQTFYEEAQSVSEMYTMFTGTDKNNLTRQSIDKNLDDAYKDVYEGYESLTKSDTLKDFSDKLSNINTALFSNEGQLHGIKINISTSYNRSDVVQGLTELKKEVADFLSFLPTLKTSTINFYITFSEYDIVYNQVKKIYNAFPDDFEDKTSAQYFLDLCNSISDNYDLKQSISILSKVKQEKIEINNTDYTAIISTHYTQTKNILKDTYYSQIKEFYELNYESKEKDDIEQMCKLILNYNSYEKMNATLLKNKFMLLKVGTKTDTEIKEIIGYNEISKYNTNEQIQIYNYLIENNKFDYNYLTSFNFNTTSGSTTNAYDYTIYTMQILNILIIVFTIFYACSSIAGDYSNGTMKMIAIRPYTKSKLFAGKFLSCVMFGGMLMLISFFASFIVGIISYGFSSLSCLVVFDARIIFTTSPIVLMLFYLLSCFINLVVYISLAMFICMMFRSNTLSVFLSSALYAVQIVLCGTVNKVWLKYTPFAHFDLFKYFGNSSFGLLKFNILPDCNFTISALVLGLMFILMNLVSSYLFKHKDIT